jgi:hypothetical protein
MLRLDARDQRPGLVFPCYPCRCHLVVTAELTLTRATNADMEKRPIDEQYVARVMQKVWSGMPQDVYC